MCFCTFEIALFSNFRALCSTKKTEQHVEGELVTFNASFVFTKAKRPLLWRHLILRVKHCFSKKKRLNGQTLEVATSYPQTQMHSGHQGQWSLCQVRVIATPEISHRPRDAFRLQVQSQNFDTYQLVLKNLQALGQIFLCPCSELSLEPKKVIQDALGLHSNRFHETRQRRLHQ